MEPVTVGNYVIRLAEAEDIESIMGGVSEGVYDGIDYLGRYIHSWIQAHETKGKLTPDHRELSSSLRTFSLLCRRSRC